MLLEEVVGGIYAVTVARGASLWVEMRTLSLAIMWNVI